MRKFVRFPRCSLGNLFHFYSRFSSIRLGEFNLETEKDCVKIDGINKCADPTQQFNQSNFDVIIHPDYSNETGFNDIALIKLNTLLNNSNNIAPICLPFYAEKIPETKLQVIGFGFTEKSRQTFSNVLMKAQVDLYDHQNCRELYKTFRNVSENNFCALSQKSFTNSNGNFQLDVGVCQGKFFWDGWRALLWS